MTLSYGGASRSRVYQYRCMQARNQQGGSDCQVVGGKRVDHVVAEVFLDATSPCIGVYPDPKIQMPTMGYTVSVAEINPHTSA